MDHVILITGSMGAGKTTLLGEASDLLRPLGIPHALVDLDGLGLAYPPQPAGEDLAERNLRSVCANYASAGITRLIMAGAIESRDELERLREITAAAELVVCRLVAPVEVMEARVAARERGVCGGQYVARVRVLEKILDAASLEDFTIQAEAEVTTIARELLRRAGWIHD